MKFCLNSDTYNFVKLINSILLNIIVFDKRICLPVLMPMVELAARRSWPQKRDAEGVKTQM